MTQTNATASDRPSQDHSRHWIYVAAPSVREFESSDRTGKWCIFRSSDEIDQAWERIVGLAAAEKILCAKVSTAFGSRHFDSHVICVYTNDWHDADDLLSTRMLLREVGFVEELGYKRDVDTARRVYGPQEWFMWA